MLQDKQAEEEEGNEGDRPAKYVISRCVAIELGKCGNWSWQSQDPWKYLDASLTPIENSIKSSDQNHK
jgi:hypothetical protein